MTKNKLHANFLKHVRNLLIEQQETLPRNKTVLCAIRLQKVKKPVAA